MKMSVTLGDPNVNQAVRNITCVQQHVSTLHAVIVAASHKWCDLDRFYSFPGQDECENVDEQGLEPNASI